MNKVYTSRVHHRWLPLGALLAWLAVAAGAFGAHALRTRLPAEWMAVYQTAALYHFLHAIGLLCIGSVDWPQIDDRRLNRAGALIFAGVVVFSGSLYALAMTGWRTLGAITPIGGVLMLLGWAVLGWATWGAVTGEKSVH